MTFAEPDNPADFNTRVIDVKAPYCGDVGGVWLPVYSSLDKITAEPEDRFHILKELEGNFFFGCAATCQGLMQVGYTDETREGGKTVTNVTSQEQQSISVRFVQPKDQVVSDTKQFPQGKIARFYPPKSEIWNDVAFPAAELWKDSVGKPFLTRQRGDKLWMMTGATYLVGILPEDFLPSHNIAHVWSPQNSGERVLVGNIYEIEDGPIYTTDKSYPNYSIPTDYQGKKFITAYESSEILTLDRAWSMMNEGDESEAFPSVNGKSYGVGSDSLFFIDTRTYSEIFRTDDLENTYTHGTVWSGRFIEATEVVPYESTRTGDTPDSIPPLSRGQPHHISGTILIYEMIYPPGFFGGDPDSYSPVEHQSHYPHLPAPRDTPWMVGLTPLQDSIAVGKFIWKQDDPTFIVDASMFDQDFRIDPRVEEGFAVVKTQPANMMVEYILHNITQVGAFDTNVYERSGFFTFRGEVDTGHMNTLECRGFDRLTENECRGAIDCVLWTEGMLLKNDAFHSECLLDTQDYFGSEERELGINIHAEASIAVSFSLFHQYSDYHVTTLNPIIGDGIFRGWRHVPRPISTEVWIRRWKKGATPPYVAFDETPGADNSNASWTIERYDILENDIKNENGNYEDWVPVACCLTPFGDFIYVMLQPWPMDTWPFNQELFYRHVSVFSQHDTLHQFNMPNSRKLPDKDHPSADEVVRRDRYWRVIRPGHWDIKTRLPYYPSEPQIPATPFGETVYTGDYKDLDYQGLEGNWHRTKTPVSITCNEHHVFLKNFPAAVDGAAPTESDLNPDEPVRFSTISPAGIAHYYRDANPVSAFSVQIQPGGEPISTTIAYEWTIDIETGKIRSHWRSHYIGHQEQLVLPDFVADTKLQDYDLRTTFAESVVFHTTFRTNATGHFWSYNFTRFVDGDGGEDSARHRDLGIPGTSFDVLPLHQNAASGWDTVQFVEGFTPAPMAH